MAAGAPDAIAVQDELQDVRAYADRVGPTLRDLRREQGSHKCVAFKNLSLATAASTMNLKPQDYHQPSIRMHFRVSLIAASARVTVPAARLSRLKCCREYYTAEHLRALKEFAARKPFYILPKGPYCKDVHGPGCKECSTCHFCRYPASGCTSPLCRT